MKVGVLGLSLSSSWGNGHATTWRALLRAFHSWYDRWRLAGGDAEAAGLRRAYQERCDSIGRDVRVLLPDGSELAGTATGIDAEGRLLVHTADGERPVAAGDVQHLR